MKAKFILTLALVATTSIARVKAQEFNFKVSRDSVGVLTAQLEALKASQKVQELKLKEFEEEQNVEKLRVKLLVAKDIANVSAAKITQKQDSLKSTSDIKAQEKINKQAKSDAEDAQRALERFVKQVEKVEAPRLQIQAEERKLTYKKPFVDFRYQ